MHRFRFGVYAGRLPREASAWPATARRAEELGYDVILVVDHLGRQMAPLSTLGAAAAVTERIRLGSYVFANDFRHPLVLAREAATIDALSNGRLELGLGAGWKRSDYRQLGVAYDPGGRRIDRMEETLGLMKRLFAGETVTHRGPTYHLDRAVLHPSAVQQPHPPIMLGGGGPRLLRLAAREADIVGLAPAMSAGGRPRLTDANDAAAARKIEIVRRAAGPRFERLELNAFVADVAVEGGRAVARIPRLARSLVSRLAGGSPYVLYGSPEGLAQELVRRRDALGISYYGVPIGAMEDLATLVERLAGR